MSRRQLPQPGSGPPPLPSQNSQSFQQGPPPLPSQNYQQNAPSYNPQGYSQNYSQNPPQNPNSPPPQGYQNYSQNQGYPNPPQNSQPYPPENQQQGGQQLLGGLLQAFLGGQNQGGNQQGFQNQNQGNQGQQNYQGQNQDPQQGYQGQGYQGQGQGNFQGQTQGQGNFQGQNQGPQQGYQGQNQQGYQGQNQQGYQGQNQQGYQGQNQQGYQGQNQQGYQGQNQQGYQGQNQQDYQGQNQGPQQGYQGQQNYQGPNQGQGNYQGQNQGPQQGYQGQGYQGQNQGPQQGYQQQNQNQGPQQGGFQGRGGWRAQNPNMRGGGLGQLAGILGALGLNTQQERDISGFPQKSFGVQLTLEQKKTFIKDGYLVIKDAIPKELVNRALRAINHQLSIPPDQQKLKLPIFPSDCPDLMVSKVMMDLLNASPAREYVEQLVGKTNPVRGTQIALRYPGHGCIKDPKKALANSGLNNLMQNPLIGGIVDQFLGTDDEDNNYVFSPTWHEYWHIDGFPETMRKMQMGQSIDNFTMLLGIYLSATPEDNMGNFGVHAGSHHLIEKVFQEHGGPNALLGDDPLGGLLRVRQSVIGRITPVQQLHVQPGDIVLAHYQTAHSIAPNVSPHIRYACYFRLHHYTHAVDQGKPDCLSDIWADFDGVRDLAREMKEKGEI